MVVDPCQWLILTIADADGGWYADDGGGRCGNCRKDDDGVPIT